ncbi:hypothetical protein [Sphingomonas arenae]|uniref:hypothetical protein n=1 Tax=Sphingomonas arenae TaxID=2812555 RepID=UPI001967FA50|nr:hypothetical protein [Sphingomonas arenae]
MNKAFAALCAVGLLVVAGCRPTTDRTEAREAGAEAAPGGTARTSQQAGNPVQPGAEQITPETLPAEIAVGNTVETLPGNAVAPPPAVADLAIPRTYQGRWGLVAADCTSTRGDAKGLLVIDGRTLRFYESVGTLRERQPSSANGFTGVFDFTGEGMSWQRTITLQRSGEQLRRTESASEQGPVDLTYTRCPVSRSSA